MMGRKGQSEHEFLNNIRTWLIVVVTWFVVTITGELISSWLSETPFGKSFGRYGGLVGVITMPVALGVWVMLYLRGRRREQLEVADNDTDRPAPEVPPAWHPPGLLHGRESEVDHALKSVRANGIVVVAGPRDIGTSAVAATVAQHLIDERDARPDRVTRFDLRSRSSRLPDDARSAAGRVVSSFGLDEPADGTAALLAGAGRRLVEVARERYDVVVLDNASTLAEVEWLAAEWPADGPPWLVIAGESAIHALTEDSTVLIGELDLPALQLMWDAEMSDSPAETRPHRWLRIGSRRGERAHKLDELLKVCFGRPVAVKAFVREVLRPNSELTIEDLLAAVASTKVHGPLERVWSAILEHTRQSLSDDAVWLLHALSELPVTALTANAIHAVSTAHHDPDDAGETVSAALEELRIRNLVQESDGRYRLPVEVRRAVIGTTSDERRRTHRLAAVPALLRYHARQTARWATRLGTGRQADEWFHDAEQSLRPLFSKDYYLDEESLLVTVIDDLAGIGDALEAWYVREQQSGGLLAVNENLRTLAEWANRPDLAGIATIRMATAHRMASRIGEASTMLDAVEADHARLPEKALVELRVRHHIERALLCMTGSVHSNPDRDGMARAEMDLREILATRPHLLGETAVLINLGALCLRQARPADALAYLRRAEKLAADQHDTGCLAHALELQGIVLATDLLDAIRLWWQAKELFSRIGDEQGEARCLQHLGSAALTEPTVAGQIRDGRPSRLEPHETAEVALRLLRRAKQLRAGQPDNWLVDHYLQIAQGATIPQSI